MKILPLLFFFSLILFTSFSQDSNLPVTVRLNHVLLEKDVMNDPNIIQSNINTFLNELGSEELDQLADVGSLNLGELKATKIFPHLTTEDSISVGRQGNIVQMPPFYATFAVEVPNDMREGEFLRRLHDYYPIVIYAHPHYGLEFDSAPNDTLYDFQFSLNPDSIPLANINIEEAWQIETGEKFIKVGVFDTGIDSTHEDLDLLTGFGYYDPNSATSPWGFDSHGHGTPVAGIIGAKRNNGLGIAGIAGGDGSDTSGVSLLDFNYGAGSVVDAEFFSVGIIDAARSPGTYYDWSNDSVGLLPFQLTYFTQTPGYGIYVGNHSYGIKRTNQPPGDGAGSLIFDDSLNVGGGDGPGGDFAECKLCKESFLFSLQNGVVNVVSRGNIQAGGGFNNTPNNYFEPRKLPASYPDPWVISVGASGTDGERLIGGVNTGNVNEGWFSPQGKNIDIIAPGTKALVVTTKSDSVPDSYTRFNGTSAAAPHASGVAALLLSKYNKNCYSPQNLDPADVEYILQESAKDVDSLDYDINTGWGLLDAKAALDMIDFPTLQIIHPPDSIISISTLSIDTISLKVEETFYKEQGGPISIDYPLENNRDYRAIRQKVEMQYYFGDFILDSTELLDVWLRHSQINSLDFYNDTVAVDTQGVTLLLSIDTFDIEPFANIESFTDTTITLSGYYYHFIGKYGQMLGVEGPIQETEDYWYPIDPNSETPKMAYSIYIRDSTLISRYEFDCTGENALLDSLIPFLDINELDGEDWLVYPNPTNSVLNVHIGKSTLGQLEIVGIQGEIIYQVSIDESQLNYSFDVKNLVSGIYFINLRDASGISTKKWIKI